MYSSPFFPPSFLKAAIQPEGNLSWLRTTSAHKAQLYLKGEESPHFKVFASKQRRKKHLAVYIGVFIVTYNNKCQLVTIPKTGVDTFSPKNFEAIFLPFS